MTLKATRLQHPILCLILLLTYAVSHAETNLAGDEILTEDSTVPLLLQNHSDTNYPALRLAPGYALDPAAQYLASQPDGSNSAEEIEDLRDRIIRGYAIPDSNSPMIANHESWYAARPDYVKRMMARSKRYLYHIVGEVERRGMPSEIALLPMVESAFNPQAYSRSKASGIWQFIPSTGKNFGLKQNWWVDNRRDVTAATDAALNYLQKLHLMFGTWDLALAAYNAGEGTVQRAIDRNRKHGLPTDYESLSLPPETRNYVPKLQAMKNIMTHPERYGLNLDPIPNRPYFAKVIAPEQIDAKLAATLAEISFEEFSALNPEYNRPVLTSNGSVHEILLPVSAVEPFNENLANYTQPLVSWQTYHAKRGERMENIAKKFGIHVAELRDVNDLTANSKLKSAMPLLVPGNAQADNTQAEIRDAAYTLAPEPEPTRSQTNSHIHQVKPRESLAAIARIYRVSPKMILAENQLKSSHLKAGQRLRIPAGKNQIMLASNDKKPERMQQAKLNKAKLHGEKRLNSSRKIRYLVKRGDTLASIARKFDISTSDLKRWNKLAGDQIAPGNQLTLMLPSAA